MYNSHFMVNFIASSCKSRSSDLFYYFPFVLPKEVPSEFLFCCSDHSHILSIKSDALAYFVNSLAQVGVVIPRALNFPIYFVQH